MKRRVLSVILCLFLLVHPSHAALPVIDFATIAQLIQQIQHTIKIINELDSLNKWEEIDHINLAGGKFGQFLSKYKKLFTDVVNEIEGYQNGGAFGQIERLMKDEIYPAYHEGWEKPDDLGDEWRNLKKQVLWTKIQMKHAAVVGAKIRDSLPDAEKQTEVLLNDTLQSQGVMQSIKIGNQLTGMVGKSLTQLNVQMGEYLQAYTAEKLEENFLKGKQANRLQEALEGFGEYEGGPELPMNPIGKFSK